LLLLEVSLHCLLEAPAKPRGSFLLCRVQRLTWYLGNFLKFLGGWGAGAGNFENLICGYGIVFMS
jgi:hypothetical protein